MTLPELAQEAVRWVRKQSSSIQAELYLARGKDRGVELKDGRVDAVQESMDEGMGLRLLGNGRMGFAYAGSLGLDDVAALYRQAMDQLRHLPPDEHRALPSAEEAKGSAPSGPFEASLFDGGMFAAPLPQITERLKAVEARAAGLDKRITKILHSGYGESQNEVVIAGSSGVLTHERGTSCSVGLGAAADGPSELQVGSASRMARRMADLDFERLADEAVWRTTALLDAKKLPSRRRAVIFDPWIAGEFLELVAGALSADAVQRGRSLFRGKLGKKVASPLVSFIDDPRREAGVASARFDDEGVPTRRKVMVENGTLKDYFYDAYTGRKDGRPSNGSAGRAGFKGMPGPTSSNFYLAPGKISRDSLIADTQDGVLLFELMGMHTADAVSGEFSVGVSGVAVQGGKITHGIRGAMISANLLDVLDRVDAVADDLVFYGSLATPTFRVADLTVA